MGHRGTLPFLARRKHFLAAAAIRFSARAVLRRATRAWRPGPRPTVRSSCSRRDRTSGRAGRADRRGRRDSQGRRCLAPAEFQQGRIVAATLGREERPGPCRRPAPTPQADRRHQSPVSAELGRRQPGDILALGQGHPRSASRIFFQAPQEIPRGPGRKKKIALAFAPAAEYLSPGRAVHPAVTPSRDGQTVDAGVAAACRAAMVPIDSKFPLAGDSALMLDGRRARAEERIRARGSSRARFKKQHRRHRREVSPAPSEGTLE